MELSRSWVPPLTVTALNPSAALESLRWVTYIVYIAAVAAYLWWVNGTPFALMAGA
jgi:hypothetical protein